MFGATCLSWSTCLSFMDSIWRVASFLFGPFTPFVRQMEAKCYISQFSFPPLFFLRSLGRSPSIQKSWLLWLELMRYWFLSWELVTDRNFPSSSLCNENRRLRLQLSCFFWERGRGFSKRNHMWHHITRPPPYCLLFHYNLQPAKVQAGECEPAKWNNTEYIKTDIYTHTQSKRSRYWFPP